MQSRLIREPQEFPRPSRALLPRLIQRWEAADRWQVRFFLLFRLNLLFSALFRRRGVRSAASRIRCNRSSLEIRFWASSHLYALIPNPVPACMGTFPEMRVKAGINV